MRLKFCNSKWVILKSLGSANVNGFAVRVTDKLEESESSGFESYWLQ